MAALPTIFVAIASYRDPECQYTVRDLFAKAAHPGRIRVGICWQYEAAEDQDCFIIPTPYPSQTREKFFATWEGRGGGWARAQALSLAQGEDYILQVDAHMRFAPGWDETLIDTLSRCPGQKAALTTCPPPYTPENNLADMEGHLSVTVLLKFHGMEGLQPISIGGNRRPLRQVKHKGPVPTPFVTANFLFAKREMFEEVPYDPHIFFRGQESAYAMRLWTHGYNLYHPDSTVIYHYWDSQPRRKPGDENAEYKRMGEGAPEAARLAARRVWHVLGLKMAENPAALKELERYGLGRERTPASFWAYAGLNPKTLEVASHARLGHWPAQTQGGGK